MRKELQELILCASIHFDDGKVYANQPKNIETGIVLSGHRHGCIFPQLRFGHREDITEGELGIIDIVQGFLTNKNRFVTREEAEEIAFNEGQIKEKKGRLYSEDLY